MTNERLQRLLQQHIDQSNSPEEDEELMLFLASEGAGQPVLETLNPLILNVVPEKDISEKKAQLILAAIFKSSQRPLPGAKLRMLTRKWKYAAAVLVLLTTAALYLIWGRQEPAPLVFQNHRVQITADAVKPGTQRAVLTLSDGKTVELDNRGTGTIQDGSLLIKNENGTLVYSQSGLAAFNSMSTPRGGQYQLTLSDGTRVWLNASSSITYPTVFDGRVREVKITGEAYFEVAPDAKKPFTVVTGQQHRIEVLGTSFNVNAYPDESGITTALVEGAVNLRAGQTVRRLQPGEIAEMRPNAAGQQEIRLLPHANMASVTAWKDGVFNFNNKSVTSIMRQLSRWYDIDVEYAGKVPDIQFWGEVGMDVQLEDVLEFLGKSNITLSYQRGKKLIVGEK